MAHISSYESKGSVRWDARAYAGIDPETGKQVQRHKRGFATRQQAEQWAERQSNETNPLAEKMAEIKSTVPAGFQLVTVSVAYTGDMEPIINATYKPLGGN